MGEPTDIHRAHISPADAKRVLVAIDTEDPGDPGSREGGAYPRIAGYTIERELGRGAGGVTYLAHKAGSEAKIALKVLHAHPGDGRASQRAWRELDTLQQVRVPSVPRLLDFGTTDHSLYIATEYIEGTPLSELHTHARPADLAEMRERVRLLERIARAAHSLHERGVIHRDLKPSNVIVTPEGEPFIIDLGIALIDAPDLHHTLTQDGQPVGTPAFMAPEQARGKREEISTRSDIYSLGAIGYWLCTGETPHDLVGVTLHEAIRRVGSNLPREPRAISPRISKPLAAVLAKSCAPRLVDRYGSALELGYDLGRWWKGEPVLASRAPMRSRVVRLAEAHPVLMTTAFCFVIALGIIGGTTTVLSYLHRRPAAVVLSASGRIATMRAVSGGSLYDWDAGDGCAFPFARFLTAAQSGRVGGLIAIQTPVEPGNHDAGYRVATFDPRYPDIPLWEAPTTLEAPPLGSTDASGEYVPRKALITDVFPAIPGDEVIQCYEHPSAFQSAIRIYDLFGTVRFEAWHWGPISDLLWMPEEGLLVVLAENWERSWSELGVTLDSDRYPTILFALRVSIDASPGWLTGPQVDPPDNLRWYRCIKPAERLDQYLPSLRPSSRAVHRDGFVDIVWTDRELGSVYFSTVNLEGGTIKSWNRRDFDYRASPTPGTAAKLGYLPSSPEDYEGLVPFHDAPDLTTPGDPAGPILPAPIAHWSFDDPDAMGRDITGHGHDLFIPSGCKPVPGPVGNAAHFEMHPATAITNFGDAPLGPGCSTDGLVYPGPLGFAVSAWFYIDERPGAPCVQDYDPHTACTEIFAVRYESATKEVSFDVAHEVSTPRRIAVQLPSGIPQGWVHIVGVYEPTPLPIGRLFVAGVERAARRLEGPMRTFERPSRLYVSGSWHGTNESTIDDVRLYDCALTPQTVWQLFQAGNRGLPATGSGDE